MKPDCLKLKVKWAAEEAEDTAAGGVTKAVDTNDGTGENAHMMLIDAFWDFNTGAEDHFSSRRCQRRNSVTPHPPHIGCSSTERAL